jgi:hypothetical protein
MCRSLSAFFESGSISLMLVVAAHSGQHEMIAVGEGGEINSRM